MYGSSSVFHDYINGISEKKYYPYTWTRPGIKKFKDLKVGETIYFINTWYVHDLTLLEIIKPIYEAKGHLYLKYRVKGTKQERYIDFGLLYEEDTQKARDNSFVHHTLKKDDGIIGTTLGETKREVISILQNKMKDLERKIYNLLDEIHETQLL